MGWGGRGVRLTGNSGSIMIRCYRIEGWGGDDDDGGGGGGSIIDSDFYSM